MFQDNRGFLLQHPAPATAASNMDDGSNGENIGGANVETQPAPKRQLRIACSHKLFVENIENPAKRLTGWPYVRQMSLDGFMEEFNIVKASR